MGKVSRKITFAYAVLKSVHYLDIMNALIPEGMLGRLYSIYDVFCDFSKQRKLLLVMPYSGTVR